MRQPELTGDFGTLMGWADEVRTLKVRTNADTPADAATARKFGAEGIGLCRTEHMFFDADRIIAVRQMILADTEAERKAALAKLLPMQRGDFEAIFKAMEGLPVTIRLLDPPLHEFLPHKEEEIEEVAQGRRRRSGENCAPAPSPCMNPIPCWAIAAAVWASPIRKSMRCRRAPFWKPPPMSRAAGGKPVQLEIMIPLVGFKAELDRLAARIAAVADDIKKERGKVPGLHDRHDDRIAARRACAPRKSPRPREFFSFGTNDLTQTTLGVSRDDAGMFLNEYLNKGVIARDPFVSIDVDGVGELIRIAANARTQDARQTQARHLRRAWRRSGFDPLLPRRGTGLCLLFAIPRAGCAARGGAGGAEHRRTKKLNRKRMTQENLGFSWFNDAVSDL